jgi:fructokinase
METKYDVIALGELLIDFNQAALNDNGNYLYEAAAGGAPCNVLSMLQKLGRKTAFIGKVGKDSFGEYLKETIEDIGINTDNLLMTSAANTSLAFVSRNAYGDRCFQFYRDPGADMLLRKDEVIAANIAKSKIFHFGTLSFTSTDAKEATCYAVECAEEAGKLISFDPNIRINLWNDPQEARKAMDYGLKKCDILKISDEELFFLTGIRDQDEAMKILKATYEIPFICLTMGRNGSCAYYHDRKIQMGAFLQEKTVDTTGAGDTFMGCVLNFVLDHGLDDLQEEEIRQMLRFSSVASSIITTRYGALKVMPEKEEIERILKTH